VIGIDELEREEYRLYARLPIFKKRLQEAKENILEALQIPGIWVLSFSGGKDSTVMLDLCIQAGWRGPLLYQTYGQLETLPDNLKMVNWARDYYGLEVLIKDAPGEFEVYRNVGHFFINAITPEEKRAVRRWYRNSFGELDKFVIKQGWTGQFLGLRIEESNQRKKVLGHRGGLYFASSRKTWTCCPIYRWNGKDIWAYLVTQELPWATLYDAPGQNRERLRNDIVFLAGSGSIRYGQFTFWKKFYPELFNQLASEWPEIRNYI